MKIDSKSDEISELVMVKHEASMELDLALGAHGQFHSAHEGWAVLYEEVDELWEHIREKADRRDFAAMEREAIQIAAMGMKLALWCRQKGREKAARVKAEMDRQRAEADARRAGAL